MVKIGLLSDTHAWWDDRYEKYFAECDEIWHAGDIGSVQVADRFEGRYTGTSTVKSYGFAILSTNGSASKIPIYG